MSPSAFKRALLKMTVCLVTAPLRAEPLPKPKPNIPANPVLEPSVVTARGQRLLLGHVRVSVRWNGRTKKLSTDKPGWWLINYPLSRIDGLQGQSEDQIARLLFGVERGRLRNWYLHTGGAPAPEPPAPAGPAPIIPTPNPTLVVDQHHPAASDEGPGTAERPLKTISAAVARLRPGAVVHVRPGVYRETVTIETSGTSARPILLEGVCSPAGEMPVISGNDVFPAGVWQPVAGLPGVYRAPLFTGQPGTCSADGKTLIERSLPQELRPGEYCQNRASDEFLHLRFDGDVDPSVGQTEAGKTWRRVTANQEGYLDLEQLDGKGAAQAVYWGSTWVWVEPKRERKQVWDPRFPQPITGSVSVKGRFRAARQTGGGSMNANKYRLWLNGTLLPSVIRADRNTIDFGPRPKRTYGYDDTWMEFPLREGWNHLVFQWDTTVQPECLTFRMGLPKGVESAITSAEKPADLAHPAPAPRRPYVSEYLVLGPFPARQSPAVFVHLPNDENPNHHRVDLAKRGAMLTVKSDFVRVRGFEIRHGAQFQQRAQVRLEGQGILLEGCLIRDSEFRGVTLVPQKDQTAAPIIVRGNWILNPGNVGIGGASKSELLTADNLDGRAPGRSPVRIEYNHIENHNWAGISPMWESGGMKLFRLTGSVIRYNDIHGGNGPGIWLDWEHYNDRLEGNAYYDGWGLLIGIEASPGPHLITNNLAVKLRPGPVWFRHAYLTWSSDRIRIIHNTFDGAHSLINRWLNRIGVGCIYVGEGPDDRHTRWGSLAPRSYAVFNNLALRAPSCVQVRRVANIAVEQAANLLLDGTREYRKRLQAVQNGKAAGRFSLTAPVDYEHGDYRPSADSQLAKDGVRNTYTQQVRHDFYGLLRFSDDPPAIGAFRPPVAVKPGQTLIELEQTDGTMRRLTSGR